MDTLNNSERIVYLDVLRGLSICFILFANLVGFSGVMFYTTEYAQSLPTAMLDGVLSNLQLILIQGKFYTLFSLLFGIGMVIQSQRFGTNISAFRVYMSKRLLVLMIIAIFHMWVIWLGDIITFYALLGLVSLTFFNYSNRTLIILAVILIFLPVFHTLLLGVVGFYPGIFFAIYDQAVLNHGVPAGDIFAQVLYLLKTDDLGLHFGLKFYDPLIRIGMVLAEGRLFKILGIFCLGIVIGRHILHHQLLENIQLLKRTLWLGVLVGLPFNIAYAVYYYEQEPIYQLLLSVLYAFGVAPLALAYAAGIALLLRSFPRIFFPFKVLGRMALTNYIAQSVIAIILFNGFGFALGGQYGLSVVWLIGICVIGFQWLYSSWWLNHFKQGPLEYLWRSLIPK